MQALRPLPPLRNDSSAPIGGRVGADGADPRSKLGSFAVDVAHHDRKTAGGLTARAGMAQCASGGPSSRHADYVQNAECWPAGDLPPGPPASLPSLRPFAPRADHLINKGADLAAPLRPRSAPGMPAMRPPGPLQVWMPVDLNVHGLAPSWPASLIMRPLRRMLD